MSTKISIGAKIYDITDFSEDQSEVLKELSKSLNFRVNQVISVFKIYDQELALVIAALSLLEELKAGEARLACYESKVDGPIQQDLFHSEQVAGGSTEISEEKLYTKKDIEKAMEEVAELFLYRIKKAL